MRTITIKLGDQTYTLATTLRVAYILQGMNGHKSYLDIFKEIDKMTLEKQIEFLYAAYTVGTNKELMSKDEFLNMCLDNLDLSDVMNYIKQIISGITGKDFAKVAQEQPTQDDTESKN